MKDLFHPIVRKWFQEKVGEPTEPQTLSWPLIKSGQNTLISAPTGTGKTFCAFLNCLNDLFDKSVHNRLKQQVYAVTRGNRNISFPNNFSTTWRHMIKEMLTEDYIKRPYSKEILDRFNVIEKAILDRPPSIEIPELSESEILERARREESEETYNRLKKHLTFAVKKPDILTKLIVSFIDEG